MKRSLWSLPFAVALGALASTIARLARRGARAPDARPDVRQGRVFGAVLAALTWPIARDLAGFGGRRRRASPAVRSLTDTADALAAGTPATASRDRDVRWNARAVGRVVQSAAKHWMADGAPRLGASIAFYTIFALAPLLIVVIAVAGVFFGAEAARGEVFEQIRSLVGAGAARTIEQVLVAADQEHATGSWGPTIGLVTALVGASAVFVELKNAFDTIWKPDDAPQGSSLGVFVRARLTAAALVLGLGFLVIASLVLSAVLAALGSWLGARYPILAPVLASLDVVVSTAVLTVAFFGLIRWLPTHPPHTRSTWIGAFATALLFAIGKHLIGLYLARASVASTYGAAGSFVIVILWVYYSAQILLFGAELTRALEERRASPPAGP
jgi:membrane protein